MRPTRVSTPPRSSTSPSPRRSSSRSTPPPDDSRELQAFVLELGRALSLAGTAVSETQERLSAVAAASGVEDARVIVLMISFGRTGSATIESIPQVSGALRLDQISSLYELIEEAERGEVDPPDGLARLKVIRAMKPRYGAGVTVRAYAFMTLGLCLVLRPTPADLPISFGLGALALLAASEAVVHDASVAVPGNWAPWLGVLVFGVATAFHFSAPEGALPWLLLVLLSAWIGQLIGDQLFGGDVSGFFGAPAMTPVALAVARLRHGPPSLVTFLPAFWLLVPGAIGLVGVTEVVGDPATASIEDLITPVGSIISVALGVLGGVTAFRVIRR